MFPDGLNAPASAMAPVGETPMQARGCRSPLQTPPLRWHQALHEGERRSGRCRRVTDTEATIGSDVQRCDELERFPAHVDFRGWPQRAYDADRRRWREHDVGNVAQAKWPARPGEREAPRGGDRKVSNGCRGA